MVSCQTDLSFLGASGQLAGAALLVGGMLMVSRR